MLATKSDIHIGEWRTGRIPNKDFPAKAKPRAFKFGPAYIWSIIRFTALGRDCRVRVLLREGREIYSACLGVVEGGTLKVLATYEFHGTEPGWHCHVRCDDLAALDPLVNRHGSTRLPAAKRRHRDTAFRVTKKTGVRVALDFFRIEARGPLV